MLILKSHDSVYHIKPHQTKNAKAESEVGAFSPTS